MRIALRARLLCAEAKRFTVRDENRAMLKFSLVLRYRFRVRHRLVCE